MEPSFLISPIDAFQSAFDEGLNNFVYTVMNLDDYFDVAEESLSNLWAAVTDIDGQDVVEYLFRLMHWILVSYLALARNTVFLVSDATLAFGEFVHLVGTHLHNKYASKLDMVASKIATVGEEYK